MGNISLVKVGGICAILVVASGIMARFFFGSGDLVMGHWFDLLAGLFSIPAALGFYQLLRREGNVMLTLGLASFVVGIMGSLFHESVRLAVSYELVSAAFGEVSWIGGGVGGLFIVIGVLLFSVVILRTSVVAHWIGWVGLIVVVAHVVLGLVLSGVIEGIRPPWLIVLGSLMVWVLAMAVVMLRLKEPVAPDSMGVSS